MTGDERRRQELSNPKSFPTYEERKRNKDIITTLVIFDHILILSFMIICAVAITIISNFLSGFAAFYFVLIGVIVTIILAMILAYIFGIRNRKIYKELL